MIEFDIKNPPKEYTTTLYPTYNHRFGLVALYEDGKQDDPECTPLADPIKITFKIKNNTDLVSGSINMLRLDKNATLDYAEIKCREIDERIQSLLAIPDMSESS